VILDGQGIATDVAPEMLANDVLQADDMCMEVAIDGSCTKPPVIEFQRAGWSLAILDPRSHGPLATMHAPVPASLLQSSAMGEHLGGAFVAQVADRACQIYADFMGVIRLGNKGMDQQLRSKTPYACVALFAQSLGGHHHIQKYNHVKAHRSGEEYAGLSEV